MLLIFWSDGETFWSDDESSSLMLLIFLSDGETFWSDDELFGLTINPSCLTMYRKKGFADR